MATPEENPVQLSHGLIHGMVKTFHDYINHQTCIHQTVYFAFTASGLEIPACAVMNLGPRRGLLCAGGEMDGGGSR